MVRTVPGFSPGVRQVYSMGAPELVSAIRSAAAIQLDQPKFWDALLYRSSILSDKFSTCHVSTILSSFTIFPKYNSKIFVKFVLEKHFANPQKSMSISDLTMIMHAIDKLEILSPQEASNFWHQKISPIVLTSDKIKPSIPGIDLYRIARFACRFDDVPVQQLIVEILKNSVDEKISNSHLATSMLNLFVPRAGESSRQQDDEENEPFFATESWDTMDMTFLTKLLNKSLSFSAKWNPKDMICFASALSRIPQPQLSLLGHPNAIAIQNLLGRRVASNLVQFKISQLVDLFELFNRMKMRSDSTDLVLDELVYRVREISPKNCVKILKNCDEKISKKNLDSICVRLLKYDTNSTLASDEILELGRSVVRLETASAPSNVARQMMKNLLPNIKLIDLREFLPIFSNLNTRFDEKKLAKIFARNRSELLDKLDGEIVGEIALSLSRLGVFDAELFCEKIWEISNIRDKTKLLHAIAIEYLANENPDFTRIVKENISQINEWISTTPNLCSVVRLMMIQLDLPQPFTGIPSEFDSIENVVLSPISDKLILVHIESFADWVARGRPSGQSLSVSSSSIESGDFVALEILDPTDDYFIDEQNPTLNRHARIHNQFISSRFVRIAPAHAGTDLIEHTIHQLAKLGSE